MSEESKAAASDSSKMKRRDLVRKGVKAAYMAPVILAAVKATERPAFAQCPSDQEPMSMPDPINPSGVPGCIPL